MNNKERYKAAFSRVHSGVQPGERKPEHRRSKMTRRAAVLAAAICLAGAFSVTAFAANLFGLKDLVLGADDGVKDPSYTVEMISLQGYSGSDEYKAAAEWAAFLENYDKDGTLLAKVGNGPTGLDEKYNLYYVYTQEMADKLEEITGKYGLSLHRTLTIAESAEELFELAGTGDFLGEGHTRWGGYVYEDGTFHIDGRVLLPSGVNIDYQLMDCVKGSFTDTLLNIGDAGSYTEWPYETSSGVQVTLALGPAKALVIADLPGSFATVNVLAGAEEYSGGLTAADLEAIADTFDFSMLK
ncbi:hypothetical protein [Papillibacter cinnamivorans]|uniref:Uncharacterized protein n=1 Tax=Papillibacter cinnamivorans DSM 12816 TaxID=1122930 RepID=A0A1W1YN43_9FIRM|nr:hypothetical protein [Papillibacter cinnamivorans]SMC37605.1 hypothetical protein SAMN02745168_0556 [Papillibacter cinnamivorans DSM 12816]